MPALRHQRNPMTAAFVLFVAWVIVTYLLEGRPHSLLRPEAGWLRLAYVIVANLLVGVVGSAYVVHRLASHGVMSPRDGGFQPMRRSAAFVLIGLCIGGSFYLLQNPPTTDVVVVSNIFLQVLATSSAEILVCWSVMGAAAAAAARELLGRWSALLGAVLASLLFGLYHFAHSPPFNTWKMVLFLGLIGLVTSIFFFTTRNLYGTIIFHNFLATIGVSRALASAGVLERYQGVRWELIGRGAVTLALLFTLHAVLVRALPVTSERAGA